MQIVQNKSPLTSYSPWRFLIWALITVTFTAWAIQFSFQHGRLIAAPSYDDIGYFLDGLNHLEIFYTMGFKGFIISLFQEIPHSPFSTILAVLSFGIFGVKEWAPYAGNAIIIFTLIAFTEWLLHDAKLWLRIVGLALVLSPPLANVAIIEFRPDIAVALLTSMSVIMALTRSLFASNFRYRCVVALIFALALLTKPTLFVLTGGLLGLSLCLGMICDWYLYRPPFHLLLARYSVIGFITVLLISPYYVLNGKVIAQYIYVNTFGKNASLWAIKMTTLEHILYYINGNGVVYMLGHIAWIICALTFVGMVYVFFRGQKESIIRMAALVCCIVAAYTVVTLSPIKHPFYGLSFLFLMIFAALLALREIFVKEIPFHKVWHWLTIIALTAFIIGVLWQDPHKRIFGSLGDPVTTTRKTCNDIVDALISYSPYEKATVFNSSIGHYANSSALDWFARKKGHTFIFSAVPMQGNINVYKSIMEKADLLLILELEEPNNRYNKFASERLSKEILAIAKSLPRFVEVKSFLSYNGIVYHLFKGTTPLTAWKSSENLGPIEGPYPQWNLPHVRWGLGSQTSLYFETKEHVPMHLAINCRANTLNQTLSVLFDGKQIFSQSLPATFTTFDIPLPLSTLGEHKLLLKYGTPELAANEFVPSVLFQRLELVSIAKDKEVKM